MQVVKFTFNEFSENTYLLFDETKQCAIIDPGCHKASEQNELVSFITQNNLTPTLLVNTHCHIDHVLGNAFIAKKYNLPLHLHQNELETYKDTGRWAKMFGMVVEEIPEPQIYINEGQTLNFGNTSLQILHTPGHSIASLSFYEPISKQLISGDVLFYMSIGRTDLPGGNFDTLISSIKTKLFLLPDETMVHSGHGPTTSIGFEKVNNPFLSPNIK
jgi:hydroxyacylglutathione hydrolase